MSRHAGISYEARVDGLSLSWAGCRSTLVVAVSRCISEGGLFLVGLVIAGVALLTPFGAWQGLTEVPTVVTNGLLILSPIVVIAELVARFASRASPGELRIDAAGLKSQSGERVLWDDIANISVLTRWMPRLRRDRRLRNWTVEVSTPRGPVRVASSLWKVEAVALQSAIVTSRLAGEGSRDVEAEDLLAAIRDLARP